MHSSLSFLVSGQAQQIFFFGFESGAEPCSSCDFTETAGEEISLEDPAPIFNKATKQKTLYYQLKHHLIPTSLYKPFVQEQSTALPIEFQIT